MSWKTIGRGVSLSSGRKNPWVSEVSVGNWSTACKSRAACTDLAIRLAKKDNG